MERRRELIYQSDVLEMVRIEEGWLRKDLGYGSRWRVVGFRRGREGDEGSLDFFLSNLVSKSACDVMF